MRRLPPTEAVHPRSRGLDTRPAIAIVDLMAREDARVASAVRRARAPIARAAELLAAVLGRGGRILLVGAGTSGRLGVMEAAEMPPTFGTPPHAVQAVIAGGRAAVFRAREGAEDRAADGRRAVARRRVGPRDAVVGITASGATPFVRGALAEARARGAATILVTCAPRAAQCRAADVVIAVRTGPEIVAGSTRLKAGTATKMVLNMLTTTAMVRLGRTYGPLMVDVRPGSAKLKARARRILMAAAGVGPARADALLARARWNVKVAAVMARTGVGPAEAARRLAGAGGSLRTAFSRRTPAAAASPPPAHARAARRRARARR